MRDFIQIAEALCDTARVRSLLALRNGELCLCQIIELVGLAPSTVSRHMDILYKARLVERRKEGRWAYFKLADGTAPPAVRQAIAWAIDSLGTEPVIKRDTKTLQSLCRKDLVELCSCYREK